MDDELENKYSRTQTSKASKAGVVTEEMNPRHFFDLSVDTVNAILMVVDRLTKERHYILCTTQESDATINAIANLLLNNVWKFHGLLLSLTADRGPQFISGVWKTLCKILGIEVNLSTFFHPDTDGQSEIANQEMVRHPRTFVNYQQDDWFDKLAMEE